MFGLAEEALLATLPSAWALDSSGKVIGLPERILQGCADPSTFEDTSLSGIPNFPS